jgi:hypothetical protein
MAWLGKTAVRQCFGVVGALMTLVGVITLFGHHRLTWLVITGLAVLAAVFALIAYDEHRRRLNAETRLHQPPGGGLPLLAPVEYQVTALRQVIARVTETRDEIDLGTIAEVLKNLPRTGTDTIYEPLGWGGCGPGLAHLVELGELEPIGPGDHAHAWRILKR